jgi:hypothetical protein
MKKIVFKKQNRNTLTPNSGMPLSLVVLLSYHIGPSGTSSDINKIIRIRYEYKEEQTLDISESLDMYPHGGSRFYP